MQKSTWKDWFIFTKRDRNAAIVLFLILAALIISPYLFSSKKSSIYIDTALQQQLDAYALVHQPDNKQYFSAAADTSVKDTAKKELFYFDPNTLSEEGFTKLGLPQRTIHTLINYRSKGGYFKTPEDIRKIYGLSKTDADRIIPYIHITSSKIKQKEEPAYKQPVANTASHQYKKTNINTATAEDWKAFPGIGEVLANRIVKFRTSMGGFKYIDQVGKTYGLNDSTFQHIKPYLFIKDSANVNH